MSSPKVFEIIFKIEIESRELEPAIEQARIEVSPEHRLGHVFSSVIRDDDAYGGQKDFASRQTNYMVILNPEERRELENIISALASSLSTPTDEEKLRMLNRATSILDSPF